MARVWSPLGLDVVLEVARTPKEQERGLMNREWIPDNGGMLFVFPDDAIRSFWMHATPSSLDLVFIDANGVIVDIVDCAVPFSKEHHVSSKPARYVAELKCGTAADLDIGDQLWIFLPRRA